MTSKRGSKQAAPQLSRSESGKSRVRQFGWSLENRSDRLNSCLAVMGRGPLADSDQAAAPGAGGTRG